MGTTTYSTEATDSERTDNHDDDNDNNTIDATPFDTDNVESADEAVDDTTLTKNEFGW